MNLNEIKQLIKIFEKSKIGELEIVEENHKIRMSRGNQQIQNPSNVNGGGTTYVLPSGMPAPGQSVEQPSMQDAADSAKAKEAEASDNYYEVRAPMVGTFYRSPAPDADPYVEAGDSVSTGQTICIIEAMKLMNEIQSEVNGKVVKIMVENAQPVEYNQVLFLIEKR